MRPSFFALQMFVYYYTVLNYIVLYYTITILELHIKTFSCLKESKKFKVGLLQKKSF